jgi:hypothetical protein
MIRRAQAAARGCRSVIAWPSNESVDVYERHAFTKPDEPLIWAAGEGD